MRFETDTKPERNYPLDIARFVAIVLMLFAHVVSFFYSGGSSVILELRNWINVVSFTTFLFISGAVTYLTTLHRLDEGVDRMKSFRRVFTLLAGYYLLALVASAEKIINFIDTQGGGEGIKIIGKVLLFMEVPGYTEFILPFIFFSILVLIAPKFFRKVTRDVVLLLAIAFGAFALGEFLVWNIHLPRTIAEFGALFFGSPNSEFYRFPLLQYLPVYLFGMYWGLIISDKKESNVELFRQLFFIFFILVITGVFYYFGGSDLLLRRWPPSLSFLGIGIAWVGFILIFVQKIKFIARPLENLYKQVPVFQSISKNSFNLWLVHTFLLIAFAYFGFPTTNSTIVIILEYLVSLLLSLFIIKKFQGMLAGIPSLRTRNLSILIFVFIILLILGIGVSGIKRQEETGTPVATFVFPSVEKPKPTYWYSSQYPYKEDFTFHKLDSNNKFPTVVKQENWIEVNFDHAKLVSENLSREDGADLLVIYWNGQTYTPLTFSIRSLNSQNTKLSVKLAEEADLNYMNGGYSVFFGDLVDSQKNYEEEYPTKPFSRVATQFTEKISIPFRASPSKLWHLYGDSLSTSFTIPEIFNEADSVTYDIYSVPYDKGATPVLSESVDWAPDRKYNLSIPLKEISYGNYYAQIKLISANPDATNFQTLASDYASDGAVEKITEIKSNLISFRYSAPLYMTWTIDWEGYDLQESYFNKMIDLSNRFGMPMTQLFNPRIYTHPEISPSRANQLTSWVKDRMNKGDEIGLHLHMHYDMVAAAGLTPKTEPSWGGREEGHDVLTTAYNYDEFLQILNWSKQKFKEHGLPEPKGFRSGGWFLDLDNLRALSSAGFTYDTSGTDYLEPYGPNKSPRDWNLTSTTKPYRPSFTNQNASSPQPLMTIWELPNNGADSTNRTADELVRRLNLSLASGNSFLKEPQILTYMSHPHWFGTIDYPVMEALLVQAEKYKYEDDNGPVIFMTEINAFNAYQKVVSKK